MTLQVAIMFGVAVALGLAGVWMLGRLRDATLSANRVYAFRMTGVMLTSGAVVLAMSATLMWQWSTAA